MSESAKSVTFTTPSPLVAPEAQFYATNYRALSSHGQILLIEMRAISCSPLFRNNRLRMYSRKKNDEPGLRQNMSSVKQHCLVISGVQEIREAPVVHENIVKAFQDHASITLDVDAITEVDLTLIQVIESARVSAAEQGRALRLSAPASGALLTALKRGGFLGESGDPRTQFWLAA